MTIDPESVCVLAMSASKLRSDLEAELAIDGYEVRCAESIAEVEARLTPSVADVLIAGSPEGASAPCALLRGLRDGRPGGVPTATTSTAPAHLPASGKAFSFGATLSPCLMRHRVSRDRHIVS
jgi:hypothetical protein